MNPWYFMAGVVFFVMLLIIGLIVCVFLLVKQRIKKQNSKVVIITMISDMLLLCAVLLYVSSHSTYYKYNDWFILHSNIHMVEQKYGEFDLGEIKDNEKGRAAYYIYTNNGPIMPDHMKHYYYMEYDEWGVIYNVYDGLQPGG